jgi:DNA-binding response OmpR family regulator
MNGARALVVDDDHDVRGLVRALLEREGLVVREAADGREALKLLFDARPDLIVLDVAMPELDGWQTLERIRDMTDVPVLMLTARDGELEKVRGLRSGADDYVTKPFGRQELLARIGALLRRSAAARPADREVYEDDYARIDVPNASVVALGREVKLTPLEFRLLVAFARHPDQVLSRDQLLDLVWGDNAHVSTDQVKLYVGYLRRKLERVADAPEDVPIETVRGFGYRYRPSQAGLRAAS